MASLERFNFHVADQPEADLERLSARRVAGLDGVDAGFTSDEAAARHHLSGIFMQDERAAAQGIAAPERAEQVPDLRLSRVQELPGTGTRLVRFGQTNDRIPVFGAHAVCELTPDRGLVSASGQVAHVTQVSTLATLSQADALKALAEWLGVDLEALSGGLPPELQLFSDPENEREDWHLVWLFHNVPATPKDVESGPSGHGLGHARPNPRWDYLVDAHDGAVVYSYSTVPTLTTPTFGSGTDEDDQQVRFLGQMSGAVFVMRDPLRKVVTYDLQFGDLDAPHRLDRPIQDDDGNLGDSMKGAVSAHTTASLVDDFYRGVLQRDGIDDKGMELVNVVNVTWAEQEPGPRLKNAFWSDDRMWYGQVAGADGVLRSLARFRDVAAHELTHGVTSYTAGLVYKDQSGALNESYSDILGIIFKNWDTGAPETGGDVSRWDWQIGAGLAANGGPLRDMHDPRATGKPDHMNDFVVTAADSGGVHTNSNIHNKAAYNVLTSSEPDGSRTFTPRECAYLFYIGLTRLGRLSNFHDSLTAATDVAASLWRADPQVRDAKVAAIRAAFGKVGIV